MSKFRNFLYIAGSIILVISLPTSRGFITVGIVVLSVAMLLNLYDFHQKEFSIAWFTEAWKNKTALPILILSLPFFCILISGLYTHHIDDWLVDVRIQLIAVFLPFITLSVRKISRNYLQLMQILFITACLVSCLYTFTLYLSDYKDYNVALSRGQHLPSFISAIRLSLMIGFSMIVSLVLYIKKKVLIHPVERFIYLTIAIFFFIFVHVLAVRSGIIIAYISLFFLLVYYSVQKSKKVYIIAYSLLFILPVLSYHLIPSFKTKINYMTYDWQQLKTIDAGTYSDSNRYLAFKLGMEALYESPVIGYGGDIREVMSRKYAEAYPEIEKRLLPHNQYLSIALRIGTFGLALFLLAFFYPLASGRWRTDILFPIFFMQIAISCLVENTIDNSVGLSYYLFWICLFLLEWKTKAETEEPAELPFA